MFVFLPTFFSIFSVFLPLSARLPVGLTGQAVAAVAYPFIMFLPTKVAGTWFGPDQRALATTIGVMANPFGVLMASQLSPKLVTSVDNIPLLNIILVVPILIGWAVANLGVTSSQPKTPPSLSAATTQMPFFEGKLFNMPSDSPFRWSSEL